MDWRSAWASFVQDEGQARFKLVLAVTGSKPARLYGPADFWPNRILGPPDLGGGPTR